MDNNQLQHLIILTCCIILFSTLNIFFLFINNTTNTFLTAAVPCFATGLLFNLLFYNRKK